MKQKIMHLNILVWGIAFTMSSATDWSWAQDGDKRQPRHRREFERPVQIFIELHKVRATDLPKLREEQKQLGAQVEPAPKGNARDVVGEKIVRSLNRVALSKLATPLDKRQAVQLWFGLYEESRDWKPPFLAARPNLSQQHEVDGLHAATLQLALAARGEEGRGEARQLLLWLAPLQNDLQLGREQKREQGERMLATPEIVPEVREWALSLLANTEEQFLGLYARRFKYFRELVAMPHLSPASRAGHLRAFAVFLQSKPKEKAEAQKLWGQIARDESLPLTDRSIAYLHLFRGALNDEKTFIGNEVLLLPNLSDALQQASSGDRAQGLLLYREILPIYTKESDRKFIHDAIGRLEKSAPQ